MRFYAYKVSLTGYFDYVGTWFAKSYDDAISMISKETGIDACSLKVYGRIV